MFLNDKGVSTRDGGPITHLYLAKTSGNKICEVPINVSNDTIYVKIGQ